MPIKDYPFTRVTPDHSRPMLWVRVTNPATGLAVETLALIDTGADDCVFPAEIVEALGINSLPFQPNNDNRRRYNCCHPYIKY
jgi:predicted aspartyl protease